MAAGTTVVVDCGAYRAVLSSTTTIGLPLDSGSEVQRETDEVVAYRQAAVTRGIQFLDERLPGWQDQIHPETLDLLDPCGCILGQLEGNFYEACLKYGAATANEVGVITPDWTWAVDHGFAAPLDQGLEFPAMDPWERLRDVWKERIRLHSLLSGVAAAVSVHPDPT